MTRLLAGLGLVGIGFALLSLLLMLFGAPTDLRWISLNLVFGVVALGTAAVINFDALRERLHTGEARRAGKYGTSALLSTLFAIAILGFLGFFAHRYPLRFDWSEQKIHSLSDQSRKVLAGLEGDVGAVAFYARLDAEPVRELLERYAYESDRFQLEFVDPNERPDLVQKYEITPDQLRGGLVRLALGDEAIEVSEVTEERITNAMVKLSRTAEKTVYFLEGHNERAVGGETANERESYGRAADSLRNENYRVETLLLAAKGEVPEDADVIVIPGATRPMLREEHEALERYLERGGSLFVLVDPRAKTDLYESLERWGVDVGDDIVVDRTLALFGRATTPFAGKYDPNHEITKDLRETTLFHVARSVRRRDESEAGFTEIVFTGNESWAERDLERFFSEGAAELGGDDLRGPVSIAVAGMLDLAGEGGDGSQSDAEALEGAGEEGAEGGEGEEVEDASAARLAVFGDSDFASNEFLEAYRNRDLFVNTVNWLLGDIEAISIRPNRARASRFQLTAGQFVTIRTLSLFVLPEAIAVMGVFVWWRRRHRVTD